MKIIIVNDYARIVGGAAKVAIMSALAFAARGFEVEFFAGGGPIGPELASDPRIKVTCLEVGPHNRDPKRIRGALRGLYFHRAGKVLKETLSRSDARNTVVHLHAYRDILTTSVADVACQMGFTTIYTAHEYTIGCPYGGFFDYRKNEICPLTGLSAACLKTRCNTSGYLNKLFYYSAQFIYSKVCHIPSRLSHIVFISRLNQRVLTPYLPASVRSTIVSNAADFKDAPTSSIGESSPFLFIGALEPHKDPVTAARAARMLGAPITFVGSGTLEETIRLENPEAVLTGWVGREEIARIMAGGRALVFPSIWYEAQPLTTLEAAACGLPIIASDASSAVEQIEQMAVGNVFEAGNLDDLVAKMRTYLDIEHARAAGRETQVAFRKLDLGMDGHIAALTQIYSSELARR